MPLPPLAEQRRIAEVLDRAEALRAKRRAALAQLDSLTQSLFLDLFGDPATNPKGWPTISAWMNCAVETNQLRCFQTRRYIIDEGMFHLFAMRCDGLSTATVDYMQISSRVARVRSR